MTASDHIYILRDFYSDLGITKENLSFLCDDLLSTTNKINRVRYSEGNQDRWLALDGGGNVELLNDIITPKTIYSRIDDRHLQTAEERQFLEQWINLVDFHSSVQSKEAIQSVPLLDKINQHLTDVLELGDRKTMFVIFNWRDSKMCDWHIDGSSYYKFKLNQPTKLTINITVSPHSYIELKRTDDSIISSKDCREQPFMIDQYTRTHRIELAGAPRRVTLAFRAYDIDFQDAVDTLKRKDYLVKKI
jgi:hypothetical protein